MMEVDRRQGELKNQFTSTKGASLRPEGAKSKPLLTRTLKIEDVWGDLAKAVDKVEKKRVYDVCNFCGLFGHYKRQCPVVFCVFCGEQGHMKVICMKYVAYVISSGRKKLGRNSVQFYDIGLPRRINYFWENNNNFANNKNFSAGEEKWVRNESKGTGDSGPMGKDDDKKREGTEVKKDGGQVADGEREKVAKTVAGKKARECSEEVPKGCEEKQEGREKAEKKVTGATQTVISVGNGVLRVCGAYKENEIWVKEMKDKYDEILAQQDRSKPILIKERRRNAGGYSYCENGKWIDKPNGKAKIGMLPTSSFARAGVIDTGVPEKGDRIDTACAVAKDQGQCVGQGTGSPECRKVCSINYPQEEGKVVVGVAAKQRQGLDDKGTSGVESHEGSSGLFKVNSGKQGSDYAKTEKVIGPGSTDGDNRKQVKKGIEVGEESGEEDEELNLLFGKLEEEAIERARDELVRDGAIKETEKYLLGNKKKAESEKGPTSGKEPTKRNDLVERISGKVFKGNGEGKGPTERDETRVQAEEGESGKRFGQEKVEKEKAGVKETLKEEKQEKVEKEKAGVKETLKVEKQEKVEKEKAGVKETLKVEKQEKVEKEKAGVKETLKEEKQEKVEKEKAVKVDSRKAEDRKKEEDKKKAEEKKKEEDRKKAENEKKRLEEEKKRQESQKKAEERKKEEDRKKAENEKNEKNEKKRLEEEVTKKESQKKAEERKKEEDKEKTENEEEELKEKRKGMENQKKAEKKKEQEGQKQAGNEEEELEEEKEQGGKKKAGKRKEQKGKKKAETKKEKEDRLKAEKKKEADWEEVEKILQNDPRKEPETNKSNGKADGSDRMGGLMQAGGLAQKKSGRGLLGGRADETGRQEVCEMQIVDEDEEFAIALLKVISDSKREQEGKEESVHDSEKSWEERMRLEDEWATQFNDIKDKELRVLTLADEIREKKPLKPWECHDFDESQDYYENYARDILGVEKKFELPPHLQQEYEDWWGDFEGKAKKAWKSANSKKGKLRCGRWSKKIK